MFLDKYEFTNRGGRSYNEDSVGSMIREDSGIFVVADGLGGHSFGEIASACVRDALLESFPCEDVDPALWLEDRIREANGQVLTLQKERNTTLKSTVAVLYIRGNRAFWAHAGDSRLYYIHENRLRAFTEDHSVAYKKYKAGEIARNEIAFDEDQSRLLRSVGSLDHCKPVIYTCPEILTPGDAFFLCTDGVWEYLDDDEIVIDLLKSETAVQWAQHLLLRMMDRVDGENDNLTMLTLMLK